MTERLMSQRTADLLLLLYSDGVNDEELKALVSSAFEDGLNCKAWDTDNTRDPDDF